MTTFHFWNFKSKGKPYLSSFLQKLKKEAAQPALVSAHSGFLLLPPGPAVVNVGHVSSYDAGVRMAADDVHGGSGAV